MVDSFQMTYTNELRAQIASYVLNLSLELKLVEFESELVLII
jgi:hypothetical protein